MLGMSGPGVEGSGRVTDGPAVGSLGAALAGRVYVCSHVSLRSSRAESCLHRGPLHFRKQWVPISQLHPVCSSTSVCWEWELWALSMLGQHSTTKLYLQPSFYYLCIFSLNRILVSGSGWP